MNTDTRWTDLKRCEEDHERMTRIIAEQIGTIASMKEEIAKLKRLCGLNFAQRNYKFIQDK